MFILIFSSLSYSTESFLKKLTVDKIPNADEAFLFSASKQSENRIILTWVMKENCFLYKDKFKISSNGEDLEVQNTKGEPKRIDDIYFGEVEVYFDLFEKEISIDRKIEIIEVTYQGCNEKGFCYPLINKIVHIDRLSNS
tara:strand:+ start:1003 stop:1422 length:420 start_codon:yes stop_codon:yes gene_type:complete